MPNVWVPFPAEPKVESYLRAVRNVGLNPVHVIPGEPLPAGNPDALLLAGGTDVNPDLYFESRGPHTQEPDVARDSLEFDLLRQALLRDVPVLGICRGLQLLNVCLGGTLLQHIASGEHEVRNQPVSEPVHRVTIEPGTLLKRVYGATTVEVNSRHHQAAAQAARALVISGRSALDHVIEGLEEPSKRFVLAVQWHPEDQWERDAVQLKLFSAFAAAVDGS